MRYETEVSGAHTEPAESSFSFLMTPSRKSFAPLCHHLFSKLQVQSANADAVSGLLRARDSRLTAHRVAFAFLDASHPPIPPTPRQTS